MARKVQQTKTEELLNNRVSLSFFETNTQDARKALESLSLEDNEQIGALDVNSLHQRAGWRSYR